MRAGEKRTHTHTHTQVKHTLARTCVGVRVHTKVANDAGFEGNTPARLDVDSFVLMNRGSGPPKLDCCQRQGQQAIMYQETQAKPSHTQ